MQSNNNNNNKGKKESNLQAVILFNLLSNSKKSLHVRLICASFEYIGAKHFSQMIKIAGKGE